MPMPNEYQRAGEIYERFLHDAQRALDHATRNQTYTTVQAVLLTFRRRVSVTQGLAFANHLPAVLRAMFAKDWDTSLEPVPFVSRAEMTAEVQSLRKHHNFAPDTAISAVATVLRAYVDGAAFDAMLDGLGQEARDYWRVETAGSLSA